MLKRLQQKWNVNTWQLALIFCTFAIGGSTCGYLARKLLGLVDIQSGWFFIPLYLLLVTLLWPLCVVIISIPLGQFRFFKTYIHKIFKRIFKS
jgi:hypothetical protein